MSRRSAPYGSWHSPISAAAIVGGGVGLGDIVLDGAETYWTESRPDERGRSVIVRRAADGATADITLADYSVLSRVHEYGGGAFTVHAGEVFFVNLTDQQIHRQLPGRTPVALTAVDGLRFADLVVDARRGRLLAVCEDHRADGEPGNILVAIGLADGRLETLVTGADFYSSPALSPDGRRLAWLSWDHPAMPWDSTELWLAALDAAGRPADARCIAGGPHESVCQPQWDTAGRLHFVADRSGWWNLYRWTGTAAEPLCPMEAEFGLPHWVFAQSTYACADDGAIHCTYCRDGLWRLARLEADGTLRDRDTPYTQIDGLRASGGRLVLRAGAADCISAIVERDATTGALRELRRASERAFDPGYLSRPEPIRFATADGAHAHGFFYPPANQDFRGPAVRGPDDERPPLLVIGHGGPTSATSTALNPQIQFWTSRGFAVVDVNYRGSTGYGRAYHQALDGGWGVVDVADCVAAARHLIDAGQVDARRCAIRGKSAGGYSTLAALTFHELFRAGASYYGISDLEALAADTHKFESCYLERLVGPYPEARERYRRRSPIHHVEGLDAPVIFFQGLEDKVVPPNQAELMVGALRAKGLPVAYIAFADERHGFRQAANIRRALEAELYFYGRVFGFTPADDIEPVTIDNL